MCRINQTTSAKELSSLVVQTNRTNETKNNTIFLVGGENNKVELVQYNLDYNLTKLNNNNNMVS